MDKISTPVKTRQLLDKYGCVLRKSLGQNFLIEPKFVDKIVAAAELEKDEIVVEIGPGIGALTQALATFAGHVAAVEIDHSLAAALREIFFYYPNITIFCDNALTVDFDEIARSVRGDNITNNSYKVVANLPYYITTPVIMRLLEGGYHYSSMVLMVQREVAQRMVAVPGTKDYGALSLGVQYYCIPSLITVVPRTVFLPRPKVESMVIKLEKRIQPPVELSDEKLFFLLIKAAFSQRRKTILNALNNSALLETKEQWERILEQGFIDAKRRGETLTIKEFAVLANLLAAKR
ncbi:MAG: 16S rRNA (adenine(1518)-N(6)/adenine(1519)-N(6))-dimethyltransferase RsmA [Bacillota bacterium]|jgi:16S rRNA (adenine1518-N6/adenine1519-N6)-dimethyltransferase